MLPDALSANEMLQADADGDVGSATPTGDASEEKAPRAPRLLRCQGASIMRHCPWLRGACHRQPKIDVQLPVTLFTRNP